MPNSAASIGSEPGCSQLTETCYCGDPERDNKGTQDGRAFDQQRRSSASRGYGRKWRNLRLLILHRDPICRIGVTCECKAESATASGEDTDENLQGACHESPSWKTATQDSKCANTNSNPQLS
jgi:hypothetical protein